MTVYAIQERAVSENPDAGPQGKGWQADIAFTLEARNKVQAVVTDKAVKARAEEPKGGQVNAANDNAPVHFLSVCAGIEAASVAWHPLGWRACLLSEIEKFPRRILAHHYQTTRLWGDFTALRVRHLRRMGLPLPAILVGGTPCQAFSVAGLRKSLADARGNLTLSFVRLAHALANAGSLRNAVWENVPGVLSTKDNAFGCFLGAIVGADDAIPCPKGGSWPNAGMVAGPRARAAWRVLDAQYFGLAQRRRRVFVVVDFGNGADPAAVLFEPVGVHGNPPPRREAGQKPAGGTAYGVSPDCFDRTGEGAGGTAAERSGLGIEEEVAYALRAKRPGGVAFAPEVARCDATREGSSQDYETTTMVAQCITGDVTHTLRAEGFDASEDGTGRGNPIVAFNPRATDVPVTGEITGALDASFPGPAICFFAKDYGGDAMTDLAPTLRAGGHSGSHANAGIMPAVAWSIMPQNSGKDYKARQVEVSQPLMAGGPVGGNQGGDYIQQHSAVRRLTPRECERLQGFPDNYTLLPGYEADGPRYKALGNSMAVPVMRWIGERIALHMPAANDNQTKRDAAA